MATSSGSGLSLETDSLTAVHWVGIVLAGLGFFGAVVLLLVDYRRRLVYAVGVPFVGIQIVVWLWSQVINSNRPLGTPDYVDKAAQVILVVILLYLLATEE